MALANRTTDVPRGKLRNSPSKTKRFMCQRKNEIKEINRKSDVWVMGKRKMCSLALLKKLI